MAWNTDANASHHHSALDKGKLKMIYRLLISRDNRNL
jgi:hypothetical protein